MKKLLFMALAALFASAASAQTLASQKSGRPVMAKGRPAMSNQLTTLPAPKADHGSAQRIFAGYNVSKAMKPLKQQKAAKFAPVLKNYAAAPRKAAAMLEEYVGYGVDYTTKKNVKWSMTPGTAENKDGETVDVLFDVIPVPSLLQENGIETIPVRYELDEATSTITIPAQAILSREHEDGSVSYILLFSAIDEEGTITLNLGEDGNLTTAIEGDQVLYGDWDTPEITYDDDDNYKGYNGYYVFIDKLQYFKPGEEPVYVPQPEFEPDGVYLHASISPSAYGYQNSLQFMPAYAKQTFLNYTTDDVDAWSWKMDRLAVNDERTDYVVAETLTATTPDFTVATDDNVYRPAELVATFEGRSSDPYIWGLAHETDPAAQGIVYCGFLGDEYAMSDGSYAIISRCDPSNSFSIYSSMGTPDVNSRKDTLSTLIMYQGKPASPLYFTGVNMLVWDFKTIEGKDFTLKCKVQKVTRDPEDGHLTLGEVIAESDAKFEDVVEGYHEDDWNLWQINWTSFYVEDEYGFTDELGYMQVEDEFAIVIEGWDNGTFSCSPMGEGDSNGFGSSNIYCQLPGDDSVYGYFSYYTKLYAGFTNAIYGFLHTDDDTNLTFGAEGGQASLRVHPMLVSSDDNNQRSARIFIDSITIDGEPFDLEEDEEGNIALPEWFAFGISGEDYEQGFDYDLQFAVDVLPEGVAGRTAEIVFMQEGAKLAVTLKQGEVADGITGDVNGDGTVDVADISGVISVMAGNASFAAADVNGDGTVDVADISNIITIMAGN